MAKFAQYAMVAAEEALKDAGWEPKSEEDREMTAGHRLARRTVLANKVRVSI
jgi:3-oxoacyl-(acyl-carrier-protein) synthase